MIDVGGISPSSPIPHDSFNQNVKTQATQLRKAIGDFVHQLNALNPSTLNDPKYLSETAAVIKKIHELTTRE